MTPAFLAQAEAAIERANRLMGDQLALEGARVLAFDHLRDGYELLAEACVRALAGAMGYMWAATLMEDWAEELREAHERQVWATLPKPRKRGPTHRGVRVMNMRERVEEAIG